MAHEQITIRALTAADESFLWEMLYQAIFIPPGSVPFPRAIIHRPEISRYVDGWGRDGDSGFLASSESNPIGAAWMRLLTGDNAGYGYVDDETPEVTIAVVPIWRGRGVGGQLLARLLAHAALRHPAISLSVSSDNPARRLYERLGFVTVGRDGASLTMVKQLRQAE